MNHEWFGHISSAVNQWIQQYHSMCVSSSVKWRWRLAMKRLFNFMSLSHLIERALAEVAASSASKHADVDYGHAFECSGVEIRDRNAINEPARPDWCPEFVVSDQIISIVVSNGRGQFGIIKLQIGRSFHLREIKTSPKLEEFQPRIIIDIIIFPSSLIHQLKALQMWDRRGQWWKARAPPWDNINAWKHWACISAHTHTFCVSVNRLAWDYLERMLKTKWATNILVCARGQDPLQEVTPTCDNIRAEHSLGLFCCWIVEWVRRNQKGGLAAVVARWTQKTCNYWIKNAHEWSFSEGDLRTHSKQ